MRDCLDQVDLSVYSWRIALIRLTEVDTCPQWVSAFPTKTLDCAIVERARRALVCVLTTYSPLLTLDVWCRSSYFPFPPPRFLHAMALWAKITSFLTKLIGQGIFITPAADKTKYSWAKSAFCALEGFHWLDGDQPQCGGQCTLLRIFQQKVNLIPKQYHRKTQNNI